MEGILRTATLDDESLERLSPNLNLLNLIFSRNGNWIMYANISYQQLIQDYVLQVSK